jgi:hypothetical protein
MWKEQKPQGASGEGQRQRWCFATDSAKAQCPEVEESAEGAFKPWQHGGDAQQTVTNDERVWWCGELGFARRQGDASIGQC